MNQKIIVGSCMLLLVVLMPVALASQTNVALTYDANGNLLTNGDKRYVYDGFNRLAEVFINNSIKEKYWYDPDGQRLKKVEFHGDGSNTTIYYISKSFVRIINSSGTYDEVYYYDEYDLIAKKDSEGKKFYHPDHLGSTTLVTNEAGEVVEETVYDPFGAVQEGGDQRFDYEGKETDFSGLQHFGARYYDPGKPKRWTQPDTLLPDVYDPQQLNRYSFERNNPYKNKDPDGHIITAASAALIIIQAIAILGIALYTVESAEYITKKVNNEATKKDDVYFVVNTALTVGTLGFGKGASAVATALIPNLDITDLITDELMEKYYKNDKNKERGLDNDQETESQNQNLPNPEILTYRINYNTNTVAIRNPDGSIETVQLEDSDEQSRKQRDQDFMERWRSKHGKDAKE